MPIVSDCTSARVVSVLEPILGEAMVTHAFDVMKVKQDDESTAYFAQVLERQLSWVIQVVWQGDDGSLLTVRTYATGEHPRTLLATLFEACNEWNLRNSYATAIASPRGVETNRGVCLHGGVHDDLLAAFLKSSLYAARDFWIWTHDVCGL